MAALKIQAPNENAQTLKGFAEQLQIEVARHEKFFNNITSAAVKNATTTKNPTIVPLLALNIAAAVRDPDSRLLNALNELKALPYDDPLDFLDRLDGYGKSIRHDNIWRPIKNDSAASLYASVLRFITALLPDYDNPDALRAEVSNASIQKLNAQLSLVKALGEENYQALTPDVINLLLQISPDKDQNLQLRPIEFVVVLSSVLEKILRRRIAELPNEIEVDKKIAVERLTRLGQSAAFQSVGDVYYRQACCKGDATLGAYALAYFAALDDARLKRCVAQNLPALVLTVAGYRGHGNNLNLMIENATLFEMRKQVFEVLKGAE